MENEALLSQMQDHIELAVAKGMDIHRETDHVPMWAGINKLKEQQDIYRGVLIAVGTISTVGLTILGIVAAFTH